MHERRRWRWTKPPAAGSEPTAARVGAEILRSGGNAVDAALAVAAIPARDAGSGRGATFIGAVARKPAAALGVQRTARQACMVPSLLANVLLAGELTCKAKLHRPPARTGATMAGLSISTTPAIVAQPPNTRLPVKPVGSQTPAPATTTPPDLPLHR
jgi:hypothetical protein